MIYQGRLEPPKGKTPEDWEDREQTLFRATNYGDDVDRPLVKSDGSYTYFAADIAYHRNKYLRGFKHMVNVLGADHSGYVKRLQAAVKAVSHGEAEIDVRICQLVRLLKNGEPFKMSKRSGDLVHARRCGRGSRRPMPTRFMLLYRRNDAAMDFDFARGQGADPRQSGVLRAVRARPDLLDVPQGRRGDAGARRVGCGARRCRLSSCWQSAADLELIRRCCAVAAHRRCGGRGARAAPHRVLPLRARRRLPRLLGQGQSGRCLTIC